MPTNYSVNSRICHYDDCSDNPVPLNLASLSPDRGFGSYGYYYGNISHVDHETITIQYDDNIVKKLKKKDIDSDLWVYTGFFSRWKHLVH